MSSRGRKPNTLRVNLRRSLYFRLLRLRSQPVGAYYNRFLREYQRGIPPDTTKKLLVQLLSHCKQSVPYYGEVMQRLGDSYRVDPEEYLKNFPILTKDIIRSRFDALKSADLPRRKWYWNATGGSTGHPLEFIQDWEYATRSGAITLLFSKLVGKEIGEREARLWGSERDIIAGAESWKARFVNRLTNTIFLNAYRMTPERMRDFIAELNARRPKLILSYVEAIYDLARFARQEGLEVVPQAAIMTSAGTLYPFMREEIEKVFQCRVFNRYGSREVGDVACERPGCEGLWVAPWGNYIEIVDSEGNPVPDGTEGEILVTSLSNYAMPMVRYSIGDTGVVSPAEEVEGGNYGQILKKVLGKTCSMFKTRVGALISPGYFEGLMYHRAWVRKFQVIQKSHSHIVFKIVRSPADFEKAELDEISAKTRLVMSQDCEVDIVFVEQIPASASGKYLFAMSEVHDSNAIC